jgi:hypothetical protein
VRWIAQGEVPSSSFSSEMTPGETWRRRGERGRLTFTDGAAGGGRTRLAGHFVQSLRGKDVVEGRERKGESASVRVKTRGAHLADSHVNVLQQNHLPSAFLHHSIHANTLQNSKIPTLRVRFCSS